MSTRPFLIPILIIVLLLTACNIETVTPNLTIPVAANDTNISTSMPIAKPTATNTRQPTLTPSPSPTSTATNTVTPTPTTTPAGLILEHSPSFSPQMMGLTTLGDSEIAGYQVVPLNCTVITSDGSDPSYLDFEVSEEELRPRSMGKTFHIEVTAEIVSQLTTIRITLNNYVSPPSEENITQLEIYDIPGGMAFPQALLSFPEISITPSTTALEIPKSKDEEAFQPNPQDPDDPNVKLLIPILFNEPGRYELQFQLIGVSPSGERIVWNSTPATYGWLEMQDVTTTELISGYFPEVEVFWSDPCP